MSFSPYDLKYLIEVANTKNISRAAERIGIAQPSLSLAIKRLEEACGVALIVRSKNGVQMTKPGLSLVARSKSLLDDWDNIKQAVFEDFSMVSGKYIIGCHPSVAIYSLPGILPNLCGKYPQLEFRLDHDLSRNITENVISFKNDFGIVINPTRHPDLVIKRLGYDEVTFWRGKQKSKLQDLKSDDAVLIADLNLIQTQSLIKQAAKKKIKFRRIINSSNLEVITSLVASGSGIGVLPQRVALGREVDGLVAVDKKIFYKDEICLVYRADIQATAARRAIVNSICDFYKS